MAASQFHDPLCADLADLYQATLEVVIGQVVRFQMHQSIDHVAVRVERFHKTCRQLALRGLNLGRESRLILYPLDLTENLPHGRSRMFVADRSSHEKRTCSGTWNKAAVYGIAEGVLLSQVAAEPAERAPS